MRWKICDACKGEGALDTQGVVNPDDFSPEEWDAYRNGAYNTPCGVCGATGKVLIKQPEPIMRAGSDGQQVFYDDEADASEHLLRMAEGLC